MKRGEKQAAAGVDFESPALVGQLLRNRRQSRGLSLEQAGQAIRVGARQILAVEEGRFSDLPPQPYVRGLVSAYATLLELEPEELLRVCGPALAGEGSGQSFSIYRSLVRKQFIWREWTVPFVFAAAAAAFAIAHVMLAPAPIAPDIPVRAPAVAQRSVQHVAALVDEPSPSDPPSEDPAAVPGVRVLLRCEGTTWAEAAPDGAEPRRYELGPGQNLELTARERLSLALGDAGVIRLRVNERELGFVGYKGETKIGLSFAASTPPAAAPGVVAGD